MEQLYKLFRQSTGVCTDTRNIENDSMFVALKGDNFDGNDFVKEALNSGAKYAITDKKESADNKHIFHVNNTLIFLQQLANHHRKQFVIPIIGITGSNGKTTTKELIASVLSKKYNVLFTQGNLNNHIGVPLTLLKLKETHNLAIVEMGANKSGDIKELVEIAEPTHGIITNIGRAHLEGFGSLNGVINTKTELYNYIKSIKGKLIYNVDDEILVKRIANYFHVSTYSGNQLGNVNGELVALTPLVEFKWNTLNYHSPIISTKLVGKYNFYNFLAAISFGLEFGVVPEKINYALSEYTPTNNRSQFEKTQHNTLILDAYNANPTSVQSALESFDLIDHENKTIILGDMLELGKESSVEHEKIIAYLADKNWQKILVGPIYNNLPSPNDILKFNTSEELKNHLQSNSIKDSLILIKGSRGIKLETVVETL